MVTNRDHVPSKALLREPYPDNLPVVKICRECNSGFSEDEEYAAAFLSVVISGSTEPDQQSCLAARRILNRNTRLRKMIESAKTDYRTIGGEDRTVWAVDVPRFSRVVVKNARGHVYFEFGEPMFAEPKVTMRTLTHLNREERTAFETIGLDTALPELGSRMLTRLVSGQDILDGWVVIQQDVYRYAVMQHQGLLVRIVMGDFLAAEIWWGE